MDPQDHGLGAWISRRARSQPTHVALVDEAGVLDYAALADRVTALEARFVALGVRPGDRVAYSGPAGHAYVEALFAAASLGAAFTPINPRHPAEIAAGILADAQPSVVVRSRDSSVASIGRDESRSAIVELDAASPDATPGAAATQAGQGTPSLLPGPDLERLALLMYTSGTTGLPKGVMLSHGNVLWDAVDLASVVDVRADDRVLIAASLYRTGGLALMLQAFFTGGAALLPSTLEPGSLLGAIARWRPTILFSGPSVFRGLTDETGWEDADLSSIRLAFAGGSPMLGPLVERLAARGIPVVQGYGMTEAAPLILFADRESSARRAEVAGVPPLFVEVRVVGPDDGDLPDGRPGELLARGPNVMQGYWGLPELTARKLRGGWLHTGDAAIRDPDGSIRILGRLDEAIATVEGPVYAGEIELALQACPEVADAVAIGLVDGDAERPAAAVVLGPGTSIGTAGLEARLAGADPRLRRTAVVVVPSIPRSAAGKPLRAAIRASLERAVGAA